MHNPACLQLVIDGAAYPDVKFFSLVPQLPAVPKSFPVALMSARAFNISADVAAVIKAVAPAVHSEV